MSRITRGQTTASVTHKYHLQLHILKKNREKIIFRIKTNQITQLRNVGALQGQGMDDDDDKDSFKDVR